MMNTLIQEDNADQKTEKDAKHDLNDEVDNKNSSKDIKCYIDPIVVAKEFERAKREWDDVLDVEVSEVGHPKNNVVLSSIPLITFEEVMDYFKSCDMSEYMAHIVPIVAQSRFNSVFRLVVGPPHLNGTLEASRDMLFAIAGCPLKNDEAIHMRVLQTIYKQLTNTKMDVARFGPHWDFVGFQGNDPATDLRGVGFLGLMHLLYMVTNPLTVQLARRILKLSHHSTQNFPFSVMGINITRIVLQTLREEKLNRECNKRGDVISVTNQFYIGVFLHLYEIWCKNGITIADSGWVLKGVENDAKKRPKSIFQGLKRYLKTCESDNKPVKINISPVPNTVATTPKISQMKLYPMKDFEEKFTDIAAKCNMEDTCAIRSASSNSTSYCSIPSPHSPPANDNENKTHEQPQQNCTSSTQEFFV